MLRFSHMQILLPAPRRISSILSSFPLFLSFDAQKDYLPLADATKKKEYNSTKDVSQEKRPTVRSFRS